MPNSVRRILFAVGIAIAMALPLRAGSYRWTTSGPEPGFIFQIVVNPQDSGALHVSAGFYASLLFDTRDRGQQWTQNEFLASVGELIQDPSNGNVLYTLSSTAGVFGLLKTLDGGQTWFPANAGLPSYVMVAIAASAPNTLYAVASSVTPGGPSQVFRSEDGAASWALVASVFPGNYVGKIAVDPSEPSVLYALLSDGVAKSVDGGSTWGPTVSVPYGYDLEFDPSAPATAYLGTWGSGVYKTVDGGQTWNPANAGIEDHAINDLAVDPANAQKLFAATAGSTTADSGLFVTTDGGQSWTPVGFGEPVPLVTAVAIDPRNSSLVYAGGGPGALRGGVFQSDDGGVTWLRAEKGLAGYYSYAVAPHPTIGDEACAVSGAKVFGTDSFGDWTLRGAAPYALTSLVSDPANGGVLYGAFVTPEPGGDGVLRSGDGGASWTPATNGLSVPQIHRLAIAPSDSQRLLAASFDGVFGTSNAGGLWAPLLSGDIRVTAFDSGDPDILYAGLFGGANQAGLLRSDDGGGTWSGPSGMPSSQVRVTDIAVPRDDFSSVYVADTNHGVYRSLDRGLTFSPASVGLPGIGFARPYRFAADPASATTLYLYAEPGGGAVPSGGITGNVFRTNDGAGTWTALPGFLPTLPSISDFAVSANGRTVYASTVSGVFQFERSFLDVADADPFWTAVDAAAMNGVTSGCGAARFCPSAALSRAAVSVFLLRGKNGAGYTPPAATGTVFSDVPVGSPAAAFIEELFLQGISAGCGGGNYCPGAALTRAAMAILVLKTKHGSAYTPPPATGAVFSDVPTGAFAADWIEQLYAEGITAGCGSGNFCPNASVLRAQAAALVVRAFGLS